MNTVAAFDLIRQAVRLDEEHFPGDPLLEACRGASWELRQTVLCILRSRPALAEVAHPTRADVIAALRECLH